MALWCVVCMKIEGIDIAMHAKINRLKKHVGCCQAKKMVLGCPWRRITFNLLLPLEEGETLLI